MRYRLTERIGSGGMAEVHRAVAGGPHGFERVFVVKRILPQLAANAEFVRMFIDEAKISAMLSHPNIVQVFSLAELEGMPVLVMEHVDGHDLGDLLRRLAARGRAVPAPVVAEIVRQCCLALDYAHRLTGLDGSPLGIVHRDVTPSNVMITPEGNVKLLDFGIARAAQAIRTTATGAGTMKGKIGYVAPEQVNGGVVDARADLFSLGAVMHEALTGRRLFAGETDLATLKSVLEMAIPAPSRLNPGVSRTLDRIVLRALRRDPGERYASAAQMGAELDGYLRRTRAPSESVRAFMAEFAEQQARPRPPASAVEAPKEQTIVLDQADVVDERPDAARAVAPPPPPRPRPALSHGSQLFAATAAAVLLLVLAGWGLAAHPRPASAPAPVGPAPTLTVEITLDSIPQGAHVARDPDGKPLGETPVLLELPRGRTPVAVWLRKPGYQPQVFKLIPHQSQPITVVLQREEAVQQQRLAQRNRAVVLDLR